MEAYFYKTIEVDFEVNVTGSVQFDIPDNVKYYII